MSGMCNRRSILQSIGMALIAGFAGCNALGSENGLDVKIRNNNSEPHTVSITISDFTESTSLDPDTNKTFANVLTYPDYPTEKEANIQMDENWEDTYKFTLGKELQAFIITVGAGGEVSYTFKGR